MPLAYLLVRALDSPLARIVKLLWRPRIGELLINTTVLVAGVLVVVTLLAVPAAWLTTRSRFVGRRLFVVALILPLAIPHYLMAYALRGMGGQMGAGYQLFGVMLPNISGYVGALLALSLYNFPYMFLNVRAALHDIDPSLDDAARSLGDRPMGVFFRVVLPQLRPAISGAALLVALRVVGDFGVVSLMRFDTFSYALYTTSVGSLDRSYGAWLAIILLGLTGMLLYLDVRFLRGLRLDRTTAVLYQQRSRFTLGWWTLPTMLFLGAIFLMAVVAPVGTMMFWLWKGWATIDWLYLREATVGSITASLPAAVIATTLAVPVAYLTQRHPSRLSFVVDRVAYLGYATPCLAFALGIIFFNVALAKLFDWGYQPTLVMLVYGYALHFLAEAIAPIRSCLYLATPRIEDASRSLGASSLATFGRVTLPLLRSGLVVALILVFLSAMKELPLTILLRPFDFKTLSYAAWDNTNEAMFEQAAPYAMTLLLVSCGFVLILLWQGRKKIA